MNLNTPEHWFHPAPSAQLDGICGMESLRSRLKDLADALTHPILPLRTSGYLFYGPPGVGKIFFARALARALTDAFYVFMEIDAADMLSPIAGEAERRIELAFQEAAAYSPCVILIHDVETLCPSRTAEQSGFSQMRMTTAFLQAYNRMRDSGKDVVFLATSSAPWAIDSALTDKICLTHIPYPDRECRTWYLARHLGPLEIEGQVLEEMADAAANCSFGQLRQFALEARTLAASSCTDGRAVLTGAMVKQVLAEHPLRDNSGELRRFEEFDWLSP